jgi:hypothetical protein
MTGRLRRGVHRVDLSTGDHPPAQFLCFPARRGEVLGDMGRNAGMVPPGHQLGDPAVQLASFAGQQLAADRLSEQRVAQLVPPGSVGEAA